MRESIVGAGVANVTKEPSWKRPGLPFKTARAATRFLLKFARTSALVHGLGNGLASALWSSSATTGAQTDEVGDDAAAAANNFWSTLTAACANHKPAGGRRAPLSVRIDSALTTNGTGELLLVGPIGSKPRPAT